MEEKQLKIEDFSPSLFWDVDKTTLDVKQHQRFIIERTLTHGTLSDWYLIKRYYGKEIIKAESKQARYLDKQTLAFCSAYFHEPLDNFRCYTLRQSNPAHWDY
ncbi:MAG: hypothetical protein R2795_00985 [Saprospiraceae bacterium]